jgi:hypothetical protein
MTTKKKETKPKGSALKKEDSVQKKKFQLQTRSPWVFAAFAVVGMFLLTLIWPEPFEDIIKGVKEDKKINIIAPPRLADTKSTPIATPVNPAKMQKKPSVLSTEEAQNPEEQAEIINQLNQKISALTGITEAQTQEITTLQQYSKELNMALQAFKSPQTLLPTLQNEPAFSGVDMSPLSAPRVKISEPISTLFEAIYSGSLSREERTKQQPQNLLANSDSSWKKALSQWVSIKKQTVEDYAMSYDEQWLAHVAELKKRLVIGDYESCVSWISDSPILSTDNRFTNAGKQLAMYNVQQNLIKRVRDFYAR